MFAELLLILGVLSVLFAITVYAIASVRAQFLRETATAQESVALSIGDTATLVFGEERRVSWQERYLDAIPAVLLVVGLFGTFVGLAISIDAAGEVLRQGGHGIEDLQRQFDALSRAVNGIGVKFLSSLVGIGMHLASRLLIGVFVAPAHDSLVRARQRARDVARAETRRRRAVVEGELIESISQIRERIEHVTALPEGVREELASLARLAKANAEVIGKLEQTALHASGMAAKFEQSVRGHTGVVDVIEQATRQSAGAVATLLDSVRTMKESNAAQAHVSQELLATLTVSSNRLGATLSAGTDQLTEAVERFGQQLVGSAGAFGEALRAHSILFAEGDSRDSSAPSPAGVNGGSGGATPDLTTRPPGSRVATEPAPVVEGLLAGPLTNIVPTPPAPRASRVESTNPAQAGTASLIAPKLQKQ